MAVISYEKDGKTYWKVYINLRSKIDPTIRVQKFLIGISSQSKAEQEDRKFLIEMGKKLERLENEGSTWDTVIDKWEHDKLTNSLDHYAKTTITDYAAMLRTWTSSWFGRVASDLNRGDGRELLRAARDSGKSLVFVRRLRNTINLVYTWGIEERLVKGVHQSPAFGIDLGKEKEEKLPEILTRDEIRLFLARARTEDHKWYPIWAIILPERMLLRVRERGGRPGGTSRPSGWNR